MHILKKSNTKKRDQKRTVSKNKPSVDPVQWSHRALEEDHRIRALTRVVTWQTRIIVLLVVLLGTAIAFWYYDVDIALPNQEAIQMPPSVTLESVDYYGVVYQGATHLAHGSVVNEPSITVLGQLYDGAEVLKSWPNFTFYVNNVVVPLSGPNYQFRIDLDLEPGPNVIETAFGVNGVLRERRQRVITYEPN